MTALTLAPLYRIRLGETIAAGETTPMMVFPIGEWSSAKYPDLPLTEDLAHELIANFEAGILGTEPVVDSSGKHDTSAPAAGWVKKVYLASYEEGDVNGMALWADVQWTSLGATLLSDDQYKYGSVEIGPVVMNEGGAQVDNVLRSLTLTNTPVLRIMPGVTDAKTKQKVISTLSEMVLTLSEVTLADAPAEPDPVAELCDKVDELLAELSTTLKGKAGIPDIRTMMRAVKAKASAHKLADDGSFNDLREDLEEAIEATIPGDVEVWIRDFGPDWVVYCVCVPPTYEDDLYRADWSQAPDGSFTLGAPQEVEAETTYVPVDDGSPEGSTDASSTALSQPAKATEGRPVALSESDAAKEGADRMKSVALKLNLAEDADEATVLAEVTKLEERVTVAETKLAEEAQAKRDAEIEASLTQLSEAGNLTPAEREKWLAEPDMLAGRIDARKGMKPNSIVDLTEHGTHEGGSADGVDLAEDLSERAIKLAEEKGIDLAEAMTIEIMNTPGIAEARLAELATRMHN